MESLHCIYVHFSIVLQRVILYVHVEHLSMQKIINC